MPNDGKVVPFKAATDQASRTPFARLPVILLQVRDKAAQHLRQALQGLFDNADDTLFEMADTAADNHDRSLFFEAMRDLRLKRKSIERAFLDLFYDAFIDIAGNDPTAPLARRGYDRQALMADDARERAQAVETMVARVATRDGFALGQLTLRMNSLISQRLDDRANPLGPALLCEYFLQAGRSLGVGIKVKLILLKLFERYVLCDVGQLYGEANQLLSATGILPDLKSAPGWRTPAAEPAHPAGDPEVKPAPLTADAGAQAAFASLQVLLSPVRGRVAPRLEPYDRVQPISRQDLLRLLSHLQQFVPAAGEVQDFDLRHQLEQLLTRASVQSGKYRRVEVIDEDVINLIAMLFDFILGDRNLPHSLRQLIARLQIPMLKVALLDKSFFSRATHPARRLLDEIAAVAMGWGARDDVQRDELYLRVEAIVQRLLTDFADDPQIFAELLAEFLAFSADERRRTELLEQRTRDAEEGRARTVLARQQVESELNLRLLGKCLPQGVVRVIEQAWSQVLLLACLKHGRGSTQWQDALANMDLLLWSVESHTGDDRARLLEQVPGLLKALREGLTRVAYDPFATSEFFAQLEALHLQAVEGAGHPGQARIERVLVRDRIVLLGPESVAAGGLCSSLPDDDPALHQVRDLRPGAWIELRDEDDEPVRGKLIAIIDSTHTYVFVDRTGRKLREWSQQGLAAALSQGQVRLLDATQLFERALGSVVSQLRQRQP
ncbi:DUF1631 domain-containing protein [Pseudomonas sp. PS01300]|uniref:DUF1631 domain-containing protein n=1 Tax=Pseudomonas sp. PS01300 TaxID=2991436 RepID=UPI00249C4569|nr:DUF1631 domain-containing protein [Pseudomonas sp. PS01300]